MMPPTPEVRDRWRAEGTGSWYDAVRWSRRAGRDPRTVERLLDRHLARTPASTPVLLDAPCGTGRLRDAIERHGRFLGLDVSAAMLASARQRARNGWLQGDVEALPFPDLTFDAVIACRLLHHLLKPAALAAAVRELVRVSSGLVLASFWDLHCLEAARRRLPLARRPRHRGWHTRRELASTFLDAGAEVFAWEHGLRFVSQQTWLVARVASSGPSRGAAG